MEKKMTKREKFEMVKAYVAENEMLVEFINHEIELLERKKTNGNSKANEKSANEMRLVYNALATLNRAVSASELIAESDLTALENENGIVSTQKVSAVLKKLIESGKVESYKDKKKTYFKIVG